MPESIATLWIVLAGSGGYILAIVTFFKDFLSVRKLELEIARLRSDMEDKGKRVVLASPEEIQKFGRPSESPAKSRVSAQVLGITVIGFGFAVLLPLIKDHGPSDPNLSSHSPPGQAATIEERIAAAALVQAMNPPDVSNIPTKDLERYLGAAELGRVYGDKARIANEDFIADLKTLLEKRKSAERAASAPQ